MPISDATLRPRPTPGRRTAYVVLAGGSGTRVGADVNKVYLPVAGLPVIAWSLRHAAAAADVVRLVLVARPADRDLADAALTAAGPLGVPVTRVNGGSSRHGSERNALAALDEAVADGEIDVIAIHDGARPLAGPDLISAVIEAAAVHGAALPGVPAPDVVAVSVLAGDGTEGTDAAEEPGGVTRNLVAVQTPQAFAAAPLLDAYERAAADGFEGTDTASVWERYGPTPVRVVPSDRRNLKVTYAPDVALADRLLSGDRPTRPGHSAL